MSKEDGTREPMDDLASKRASDSVGSVGTVRWRDFSLIRWSGFVFLIGGGSTLFTQLWWLGIIFVVVGLLLVNHDNGARSASSESADQ